MRIPDMDKEKSILASIMANYLQADLVGPDMEISGVASLSNAQKGKLSFISNLTFVEDLSLGALFLVHIDKAIDLSSKNTYIKAPNPRLAYARVVEKYFYDKPLPGVAATAIIAPGASIGENCFIGEFAVVEEGVVIGENSFIGHHVVIGKNCVIGSNCMVNAGSIIGSEGLGSIRNADNIPVMTRHLGRVIIQDNVEIGANSTIQRGTIDDTIIEENVKTSPQINIGHNCKIGRNTEIASGTHICGSVVVGEGCFLGAQCTIRDGISIGKNARIGLGAVVIRDVGDHQTIMGLEGLSLRHLIKFKNKHDYK